MLNYLEERLGLEMINRPTVGSTVLLKIIGFNNIGLLLTNNNVDGEVVVPCDIKDNAITNMRFKEMQTFENIDDLEKIINILKEKN